MNRWHAVEGAPNPLGATWIEAEQVYNFAIYSKHATGIVLLLYTEHDVVNPVFTYRMTYPENKTGRWRAAAGRGVAQAPDQESLLRADAF
jgi:pullulanase/glycogen debranching enzyme